MSKVPTRFKVEDELDGDETLKVVQARRAGNPAPRFETPAYRKHRADVLREGGLDDEAAEDDPVPLEDQSPGEHLRRIQEGRR